jgi:GT2 family glycosyltransferase
MNSLHVAAATCAGAVEMDVSILVISYNTRDLTLACLDSVFKETRQVTFEVILLDNASADGSADAVAERYRQVRLIRSNQNLGFAKGNNVAAREARGEYLLLLNSDTLILDGAVDKVMSFARSHPETGIVGGRTYFGDGSLNPTSCHGRPTPWSLLCMGLGLSSMFRGSRLFDPESIGGWKRDSVREVDAVTGCFFLIRRSLWELLGGFDERFFMYGEETDLCLRAWKAGSRCAINPEATLIHYGGKSERTRADKMAKLFRAKTQLFEKHWRPGTRWFGGTMLRLWAFTRMAGTGLLANAQPSRMATYEAWREIWRRRAEWSRPL